MTCEDRRLLTILLLPTIATLLNDTLYLLQLETLAAEIELAERFNFGILSQISMFGLIGRDRNGTVGTCGRWQDVPVV